MKLTVPALAALFEVSERTVYRWIAREGLPARKVQGRLSLHRSEAFDWAVARGMPAPPALLQFDDDDGAPGLPASLRAGRLLRCTPGLAGPSLAHCVLEVIPEVAGVDRAALLRVIEARPALGFGAPREGLWIPGPHTPLLLDVPPAVSVCRVEPPASLDGQEARALLVVAVPAMWMHLHLLGQLGAALHDPGFVDAVLRAPTIDVVADAVHGEPAPRPAAAA